MRVLMTLILAASPSVHAFQFGIGMQPGMDCPNEFGAAPGSFSGMDEISNLKGRISAAEEELEEKEEKLDAVDEDIAEAKRMIKRVVKSSRALSDIERHYEYRAFPEDYSPTCNSPNTTNERGASAGSQSSNVVNRPSRGSSQGQEDPGLYKVPLDYCVDGQNDWQYVVAEDGMVLDEICDFEVPLSATPPDKSRVEDCRDGLDLYYKAMAKKESLKKDIAELNKDLEDYDSDSSAIEEEISEGTYCPFCNSERSSGSELGAGKFLGIGVALLKALYERKKDKRERQRQQPMLIAVPRSPFMGAPMPAQLPGYHGIHPGYGANQGIYGAVPGGINPGAFACQGTTPFADNPFAPPVAPYLNSQANPYANPYGNPYANPYTNGIPQDVNNYNRLRYAQNYHPLLNPGHGPGYSPTLGNGVYPYPQQGQYPPGVLPYSGPNSPWPVNPNLQNGTPFRFPTSYLNGQPNAPYNLGAPRFPLVNPGGSYMGPGQNLGHQIYQLQQGVQQIGNGGAPPAVLPLLPEPAGR